MTTHVRVSARGAARWQQGHPWIYRSDVVDEPEAPGLVTVIDARKRPLGQALYSPRSEIRLRLLESSDALIDAGWWNARIAAAVARRTRAGIDATAFRLVHGEGDQLPSLVVDRYDRWLVVQLLSAGLETMRPLILDALIAQCRPEGILLRNDVGVRRHEGLPETIELVHGSVPEAIEMWEGPVRMLAAPWTGQKTGAFLDQRPNRLVAGALAAQGGEALDCFSYHGSFALHLARSADRVVAVDTSREALRRAADNAALNQLTNIEWREGDAFEILREYERAGRRFRTVVLDPPAFAKTKSALPEALRGYKEINLRGMRLLEPGGALLTASCSFHLRRPEFLAMLADAAADSGRMLRLERILGQDVDHPEIVTIPETGYLKGAVLRAE